MIAIEPFNGPLKPLDIAHWLSSCEDSFDESSAPLEDKEKIHAAGKAIARSGETQSLHYWFVENCSELEEQTWWEFKETLRDQALGKGWHIRALQDFFTTTHEGKSLEDYFTTLDHKRFIIKRDDPVFDPLDDWLYKCYLLFHAPPALVDRVLKDEVCYDDRTFNNAKTREVKAWLRKYDDGAAVAPSATVSEIVNSGTYLLSGLPGVYRGNYGGWNDLHELPNKSTDLGPVTKIRISWIDNYKSTGISSLSALRVDFSKPATWVASYTLTADNETPYTLSLDTSEYIKSVNLSYQTHQCGYGGDVSVPIITGIRIMTSNPNKALSVGNIAGIDDTITAPTGWRIVGFYGSYCKNYFHHDRIGEFTLRSRLGAIFLPV